MSTTANFTAADGWFSSEDKQLVFNIQAPAGGVQDIAGWTIKFSLAATFQGANLAGFPITADLDDAPNGVCSVTILAADTVGLAPKNYYYTLWRSDVGNYALLSHGTAMIQASETTVP